MELQATTCSTCFIDIVLLLRILLNFARKSLGLEFGPFKQDDENTFYLINGFRYKTYTVKQNPDVLNYPVYDWERGKSASQLFNIALGKVSEKTFCFYLSRVCYVVTNTYTFSLFCFSCLFSCFFFYCFCFHLLSFFFFIS